MNVYKNTCPLSFLSSYLHNVPDPFTLSKCPNVVFTLNNTKKCTKMTPNSDNPGASIYVQSVSDFAQTKTVQILDLDSYKPEYFTF